jgi:chemotaxis protein MotB
VFTAGQIYLSQALSGRDKLLDQLRQEVNSLGDMLALERHANADLKLGSADLSTRLKTALAEDVQLKGEVATLTTVRSALEAKLAALTAAQKKSAEEASGLALSNSALQKKLASAEAALSLAQGEIASENAQIAGLQKRSGEAETALAGEKKISKEALLKVQVLSAEIAALRERLTTIAAALDLSNGKVKTQEAQIADLGKRLNVALLAKVNQLARYRSEFFGEMRKIIGKRDDIRIVGDRFVFQANVLFPSGSADLTDEAKATLRPVFEALKQISDKIPKNIDWILQVDGFTDARPISSPRFPSNWELSAARAISVVRYAMDEGLPRDHLAAEGYGPTHPLDPSDTPQAYSVNRRIELRLTQR